MASHGLIYINSDLKLRFDDLLKGPIALSPIISGFWISWSVGVLEICVA